MRHLDFLCSDEVEGRLTLSKGSDLFAHYAAKEFKKYGLQEGPNKGYFHYFDTQVSRRATAKNIATFQGEAGKRTSLELGKDFVLLVGSANLKTVEGDVVYAGYGLDDDDWNDFKDADLTGKVRVAGLPSRGRAARGQAQQYTVLDHAARFFPPRRAHSG